jgi:hypothetical protein
VLRDMARSHSNKRGSDRRKVALPLWLRRMPGAGSDRTQLFRIMAVDISKKGVGCLSRRRLEMGESFVLPLRFAEGGGELVLCRVRFLRQLESGHFRIGAEFVATTPDPTGRSRIPREWLSADSD